MEPFDVGQRADDLLGDAVREIFIARVPAHVDERQHGNGRRRGPGNGRGLCRRAVAQEEIPDQTWSRRERADADEHEDKLHSAQIGRGRPGPLEAPGVHVEDPRQGHNDGESDGERDDDVGQHGVGPMQRVHDRFDDLQDGERGNAVPDQCAEDSPALELPE